MTHAIMTTDDVLFRIQGQAGIISLNRPRPIHALTHAMILAMSARLIEWASDPAVAIVLLDHAAAPGGDPKLSRGFCSGGDVAMARASVLADGGVEGRRFFHDEYRLNHQMFTYAKPIVAFMDGIVMGGGVGIARPARWRVATANTRLAMPEAAIGLFPDVGAGWYLSRLPGRVGRWLALTGAQLDGAECVGLGLATHYLPVEALAEAKARIAARPGEVEAILDDLSTAAPDAAILSRLPDIDRLFASDRLEDIVPALAADGGDWANETLATLRTKSPQTCKVALRELTLGVAMTDFAENMAMEYRLAVHALERPDFVEGVRAVLVDKDQAPRWNPATPEGVSDALVESQFAALAPGEEWTAL